MGHNPNVSAVLVGREALCKILGIADNSLRRYIDRGWIVVAGKGVDAKGRRDRAQLFEIPTPQRIAEIRGLVVARMIEGAKLGRERAIESGGNLRSAAKGRETKSAFAAARRAEGLLNKRALSDLLRIHVMTLNYWLEEGFISPARVSETGKQMWFQTPSDAERDRLDSLPKHRAERKERERQVRAARPKPAPKEPRAPKPKAVKTSKVKAPTRIEAKRALGLISRSEFARTVGVSLEVFDRCVRLGVLAPVAQDAWATWFAAPDEEMAARVRAELRPNGRPKADGSKAPAPEVDPSLVTLAETSVVLGVSQNTIAAYIERGWVVREKAKRGRGYLFAPLTPERIAEIHELAREHRAATSRENAVKARGRAAQAAQAKPQARKAPKAGRRVCPISRYKQSKPEPKPKVAPVPKPPVAATISLPSERRTLKKKTFAAPKMSQGLSELHAALTECWNMNRRASKENWREVCADERSEEIPLPPPAQVIPRPWAMA